MSESERQSERRESERQSERRESERDRHELEFSNAQDSCRFPALHFFRRRSNSCKLLSPSICMARAAVAAASSGRKATCQSTRPGPKQYERPGVLLNISTGSQRLFLEGKLSGTIAE